MEWLLELALVVLLAATLFHALRLERALGVLKRDRAALEALVSGFNASTRAAEDGIARLREAADGAGRQIARHVDNAVRLKDDIEFLIDRGNRVADRLERHVREGRTSERPPEPVDESRARAAFPVGMEDEAPAEVSSQVGRSRAEMDLIRALRLARAP